MGPYETAVASTGRCDNPCFRASVRARRGTPVVETCLQRPRQSPSPTRVEQAFRLGSQVYGRTSTRRAREWGADVHAGTGPFRPRAPALPWSLGRPDEASSGDADSVSGRTRRVHSHHWFAENVPANAGAPLRAAMQIMTSRRQLALLSGSLLLVASPSARRGYPRGGDGDGRTRAMRAARSE
jgi:hypothetical protein